MSQSLASLLSDPILDLFLEAYISQALLVTGFWPLFRQSSIVRRLEDGF